VAVGKYPVSHVEISIPEWAVEGVGLEVDVVNYLAWFTGEGELFRGRYDLYFYHSDDRRQIIVAWVSDRFPPPPPPTTPAGLPAELEVTSGPEGLSVRAVNAKLAEVANAIAAQTGFAVSTPADSELRVSLRLRDLPAAEVIGAIARGCGLSAGQRPDGSWTVAAGVGASGGYEVATTRRVELHYLRAVEALDLLPNFLLQYLHVDGEGNAIIVTGPPWMCERVAADLAKLDAAPAQVALEVTAVEYSSEAALARSLQLDYRGSGTCCSTSERSTRRCALPRAPPCACSTGTPAASSRDSSATSSSSRSRRG
jgi:type II secretory pathway component GspD/PulD (secretin)